VDPRTTPAITLIIPILLVTFGYGLACWIWPFTHCPRCHGAGRQLSPSGRAFRLCRRCSGTGRRLRLGRRIYNRFSRIRKDSR
jgi:hypothetical protein